MPDEVLQRYENKGATRVEFDEDELEMLGVRAIKGNFAEISDSAHVKHVVRHHPQKLAQMIFRIAAKL